MRVSLVLLLSLALCQAAPLPEASTPFPQTEIRVDTTRAALYLPDAARGYYRGTRFDWSGVVSSLRWNGHEYFGEWFDKHDPVLHDGITGPVDEFLTGTSSLGYEEAADAEKAGLKPCATGDAGRSAHDAERSAHVAERAVHVAGRSAHVAGRSAHNAERSAHVAGRSAHDAGRSAHDAGRTGSAGLQACHSGTFVRIGVGAVKKPAGESAYQRFATYEIVDHGKWTVTPSGDHVTFVHELSDTNGYAYRYEKVVRVSAARLMLEYKLRNTGRKRIDTTVYNHNFFTLDRRGTGPESSVTFAFDAKARRPMELAAFDGRRLRFTKAFGPKETMFTEIDGFGTAASDYDFRIENRESKAGVRITSDRPLDRLSFWSHPKTICPEPFIDVSVEPGAERTWFIHYELYDVE